MVKMLKDNVCSVLAGVCCTVVVCFAVNIEVFGLSELTQQKICGYTEEDRGLILYEVYSENDNYTSDRGVESWLRDSDCLVSENFIDKVVECDCVSLKKIEDEFYLWFHVTAISSLFNDSWSTDARDMAAAKLKNMQNVYCEHSTFDFFRTRAKYITDLIDISKLLHF
jgi:hypothetical protein